MSSKKTMVDFEIFLKNTLIIKFLIFIRHNLQTDHCTKLLHPALLNES